MLENLNYFSAVPVNIVLSFSPVSKMSGFMILESVLIYIEIFWKKIKKYSLVTLVLHLVEVDTDRELDPDRQANGW